MEKFIIIPLVLSGALFYLMSELEGRPYNVCIRETVEWDKCLHLKK